MDIRLWKGYPTSTPEEQHDHQEKWLRRLQKQMSGEPNSSITAAFSEYQVITLPLFLQVTLFKGYSSITGLMSSHSLQLSPGRG